MSTVENQRETLEDLRVTVRLLERAKERRHHSVLVEAALREALPLLARAAEHQAAGIAEHERAALHPAARR